MSSAQPIAIEAGTLFTPTERFSPGRIIVEGQFISSAGHADAVRIPSGVTIVDAKRMIVTPGFIDPHIHGCGGADVMDGTYDSLNTISRILARHGTTAFLPTTVSSPPAVLTSAVDKLGGLLNKSFDGARPAGIHLEGPFISAEKRGTHKAANVLEPDPALFKAWLDASRGSLRLITVAPELPGVSSIVNEARKAGVHVAMGHSNATFEEASNAAGQGMNYAVHTFNAMREMTHRDPGIVGFVLSDDRIFAEIIADGIHVNPAVIRVFGRAKKPERVLLITDAISATDMPDGPYKLGMDTVTVTSGVCRNSEGRLAGSTLTQDRALKNFIDWSGFRFQEALLGLTLNPARVLKLHRKGVLESGADADFTVIDEKFRVNKTFVAGKLVFDYGQT